MKVADTKEDRLIAHHVEQLNKLGYFDTEGKSLYQLTSILKVKEFEQINHDSPKNAWFE